MLSVLAAKGVVLGVLFLMTFGLGLIPVKLMTVIQRSAATTLHDGGTAGRHRLTTYKRVVSFLSCFAGGVFLATCFLDLLPSVRKKLITVLFELNITTGFPLAEFIMSLGLFFILIVEQIVLMVKEQHAHSDHDDPRRPLLGQQKVNTATGSEASLEQSRDDQVHSDHSITGISDQPDLCDDSSHDQEISSLPENTRHRSYSEQHHHHHHHHGHNHSDELNFQNHSPLRALMLLMALSLHSVFEGLAVGLQGDSGQVLGIFAALVLHKSILSFSIGMNLIQSRLSTAVCIKSILFFSLTAPVGVAVGMVITDLWETETSYLVDGILQGVASGTFLYISFFEVLPAEFNSSHDRMLKLLMLLLGYSTVTAILFLSDDVKAPFCKIDVGN